MKYLKISKRLDMWLILSFVNAIASGLQNAYFKKRTVQINPIHMAWSVLVVSSILFSPLFLLGIPHLNNTFWIAVFCRLLIDSLAFTLYIKALQLSPLSLVVPMLSFQTLLIFVTQYFIDHLVPTPLGVVGVVIVVFGIYFLHFDHDTKHILSPFKAIYKEKGVMLAVFVAILWSFVVAFQKLAVDNSNPYFYTAFFQLFWAICFAPVAFFVDRKGFANLFKPKMIKRLFPAGAFDAIQVFPQYIAYSLAIPVYVNAVGNTQILFSSFFGWLFYKEKLQKHVIPTILIVIGVVLVTLAQK